MAVLSPETIRFGSVNLIMLARRTILGGKATYKSVRVDNGEDVKVVFVQNSLNFFVSALETLDELKSDVFNSLKISTERLSIGNKLTGAEIHSRAWTVPW